MLIRIKFFVLIFVSITLLSFQSKEQDKADEISFVSWNIQHMGGTKDDDELTQIAKAIKNYDLVAIQEVTAKDPKGAQAVARLADILNRMGAKWDYAISMPTRYGSPQKSERYAYLWKPSKVTSIGRPFLDKELAHYVTREPFIGKFKKKGTDNAFYIVNFHSKKHSDHPETEIKHFINYSKRLNSSNIIIAGDFNLNEQHAVWNPFYENGYKSGLKNTKTTLKRECKNGTHTYHAIDNFYCSSKIRIYSANAIDLVRTCDRLNTVRALSDHLPIVLQFSLN